MFTRALWTTVAMTIAAVPVAVAQEDADDRDLTLDAVEVTGQREASQYTAGSAEVGGFSAVDLSEIPQSVQVLTDDVIADQGAVSLAEVLNNVASASPSLSRTAPFGTASTRLRGQQAVIYRDGLRDVDFSDIDSSALINVGQIEVLKGPGGIVYGGGGPGGIINLITKKPLDERQTIATVTLGERSTTIASIDHSQPIMPGFGVRLTGEFERSDSFIDFSEIKRDNFSAIAAYDRGGPLSVSLAHEYMSNRDDNAMTRIGLPAQGTIVPVAGLKVDRRRYLGEPNFDFTDSYGHMTTLRGRYDLTDSLFVDLALRAAQVNFDQAEVRTLGPVNLQDLSVPRSRARALELTQDQYLGRLMVGGDFRLAGLDHQITAGIEAFTTDLVFTNFNIPNGAVPPISLVSPVYLQDPYDGAAISSFTFTTEDTTEEIFFQDLIRRGPLTLTLGVRHAMAEFSSGASSLDETIYQSGATWKFDNGVSVFGGYNTGFESNSGLATTRSRNGEAFEAEFFEQAELGLKADIYGGFSGTLSVFDLTRSNILVTDPVDAAFLIQGGEERTRGVEADVTWSSGTGWQVRGGYAYLDPEISSDTDAALQGQQTPGASQHQWNLLASYTFEQGPLTNLRLSGNVSYVGEAFASTTNTVVQPDYTLVNLTASYTFANVKLEAIATNAFDERYFLARNDLQVVPGVPRLVTARASLTF